MTPPSINPTLDLQLVRVVDVSPDLVWKAYTTPELLKQWFCPRPWTVSHCEVDLRPGGRFATTMRSPEGDEFPGEGCYLEIVPARRLVWTNALQPDYRPVPAGDPTAENIAVNFSFTAIIDLEPEGTGTRYTATVLHADPASQKKHEEMGFHGGWSSAFDQLVALMQNR